MSSLSLSLLAIQTFLEQQFPEKERIINDALLVRADGLPILPLFWLELAGVGYGEILAGTVWDTTGVF